MRTRRNPTEIPLSPREIQVVELMAIGKTLVEIAMILKIKQTTVHFHTNNAKEKLNTSNAPHTVVEAIRQGYIKI